MLKYTMGEEKYKLVDTSGLDLNNLPSEADLIKLREEVAMLQEGVIKARIDAYLQAVRTASNFSSKPPSET